MILTILPIAFGSAKILQDSTPGAQMRRYLLEALARGSRPFGVLPARWVAVNRNFPVGCTDDVVWVRRAHAQCPPRLISRDHPPCPLVQFVTFQFVACLYFGLESAMPFTQLAGASAAAKVRLICYVCTLHRCSWSG